MRTVTRLEYQKKNQERVNVYLDDEFAFGLNLMDAAQLRRGQQLSEEQITELLEKDAIAKAVERGILFLSYRPRSRAEVRKNLLGKDLSEDVVNLALERLTHQGYLDDRQFARFWLENRNQFKPRGHQALRYELRQKGITDSLINELLEEIVDEDAAAYDAAQSRIRRYRGKPRAEFRKKLGSFLQRRGFNYGVVNATLQRLQEEIEAETPDYFLTMEDEDNYLD